MLHELDLELIADGIKYDSLEQEAAMYADMERMVTSQNLTALWPSVQIAADDGIAPFPLTLLEIYSQSELVALTDTGNMVKYTLFVEEYGDGYHEPREHCEYVTYVVL
jgi:hypothetical protein